jgi:hypothetical protein
MQRDLWIPLVYKHCHTGILNNHIIDPKGQNFVNICKKRRPLSLLDQRVERQICFYAPHPAEAHSLLYIFRRKTTGTTPGIKGLTAKLDGIGTGSHRRFQAGQIARRR